MQEEFVELGMCPFDLTAIHGLTSIEHVHEYICVFGGRLDSLGEELYFTPSERVEWCFSVDAGWHQRRHNRVAAGVPRDGDRGGSQGWMQR
jgi:hypothetical protein